MFETIFKTYDLTKGAILFGVIIGLLTIFVVNVAIIDGPSMEPTLQDKNWALLDKSIYRFNQPQRADVIDLKFPGDPDQTRYVKRIVAMPGEEVKVVNDQVFINGQAYNTPSEAPYTTTQGSWKLQDDQYFVLGDNYANSSDSRVFGPVERRFIIGKLRFVIWPPSDFKDL